MPDAGKLGSVFGGWSDEGILAIPSVAIAELERLDEVVREVQIRVFADDSTVIRLGRMRDEVWDMIAQIKRAETEMRQSNMRRAVEPAIPGG